MLRGFVNSDKPRMALRSYIDMLRWSSNVPDRFTFPSLLKGCAHSLEFKVGKILHGQVVKYMLDSDLYIETTLLNMYAACGDLNSSRVLFEKMSHRNEVVWTSMISGYTRNHCPNEALLLYEKMEEDGFSPDEVTMATLVSACAELKDLGVGMKLHSRIREMGMRICAVLGSALVDMYAKCGELKTAREVFDHLSERDVYAWSALIFGYVKNNRSIEALKLFRVMAGGLNMRPNEVTILAVVSACAQLGDSETGRWVHDYIARTQQDLSVSLSNSLIDMYSKCGEIDVAKRIFDSMSKRDLISWNSMINGLALHGLGREALARFHLMQMTDLQPDDITFIGVLTACSHAGLVHEGKKHFHEMEALYAIRPKLEHYGCMVDLLCRAGHLVEAREFIRAMPLEPNGAIWGSMLGACRVYNNIELGEEAARCLVAVQLSSITSPIRFWLEIVLTQKQQRQITVRDRNRFHHFKDGSCSCRDYW